MALATSMASQLTQGRDSAALLAALLRDVSPPLPAGGAPALAGEILHSFDGALAALSSTKEENSSHDGGKRRKIQSDPSPLRRPRRRLTNNPDAPVRVVRKKTMEDGCIWRKYGQKEILNSKYQRCYFRCTHRHEQYCQAKKQVQQSEEDPSIFVITYIGEHTCTDTSVDERSEPFVINFGSNATSSANPQGCSPFSCSRQSLKREHCHNDEVRSDISQGCSTPDMFHGCSSSELQEQPPSFAAFEASMPLGELMGAGTDICRASPSLDWEFGENSFWFDDLMDLDQFVLFQ